MQTRLWYSLLIKHKRNLLRLVLFIAAGTLLTFLYPDFRPFRYEFEKNKPWQYADLFAPFDFMLSKSTETLRNEQLLVRRNAHIFVQVCGSQSVLSENDSLAVYLKKQKGGSQLLAYLLKWQTLYRMEASAELLAQKTFVYGLQEDFNALPIAIDQIQTAPFWPPVGILQMSDSVKALFYSIEPQIENLFKPNLCLDTAHTRKSLNDKLSALSPFSGQVNRGDLIVAQGQNINESIYTKLLALNAAYKGEIADAQSKTKERLGIFLISNLLLYMLFLFLKRFRPQVFSNIVQVGFILVLWLGAVASARAALYFDKDLLLLAPIPILPIVLRAFFDTRLALFVHMLAILSIGVLAPEGLAVVLLFFVAGFYAIVSVDLMYRRGQLFLTLIKITVVYFLVFSALLLYRGLAWNEIPWNDYGLLTANGLLTLFAFPIIYISEKLTGLVSDVSLLELTDTNRPLLRELAQKAPGTFQHSLQVANLCEAAAIEVGGNPLLVRAGALYHDVGKMLNPMYFIENQAGGSNPHQNLPFEESAKRIIAHVKDGIQLARRESLPETIIDFIRTHHGNSTVQYFYKQHLNYFPDQETDLKAFSYPGPKPFSLETAILMMADSVEAAARSLKSKGPEDLDRLVDQIIDYQLQTGQFQQADISLKQIEQVRKTLKSKLHDVYHFRIAYPD